MLLESLEQTMDYQVGDIVTGTVRSVDKRGILVDIKYKSDGFISSNEYSYDANAVIDEEVIKEGDSIKAFIVRLESKEGYTILSKKKADYEIAWNDLVTFSKSREQITVRVISKVEGGLVSDYVGIKGFIPASQIGSGYTDGGESLVGQNLDVSVLQADRKSRKVIFSHKAAQKSGPKEDVNALMDSLDGGDVKTGRVSSIKDFGVFVDIGGIEGLVHISEMSWSRVKHPSEVVSLGEEIKVFIIGVDKENRKVSLGMKQLVPDPWVNVSDKYQIGKNVTGVITRITTFGAFIKLEEGIEGLIHISQLSNDHVTKVENVVAVGDEVCC